MRCAQRMGRSYELRAFRPPRSRLQARDRVDGLTVDPDLEVEVGTGGVAGRAFEADRLVLDHPVGRPDERHVEVPVERREPSWVRDDHVVAVTDLARSDDGND